MDQTNIKICCIPFIWRDYTSSKPNSVQDNTSTNEPFERIDQLIRNTSLWDWFNFSQKTFYWNIWTFLSNRGLLIKWICTLSWPDIMRVRRWISSCAWDQYSYFDWRQHWTNQAVSSLALVFPRSKVQHIWTLNTWTLCDCRPQHSSVVAFPQVFGSLLQDDWSNSSYRNHFFNSLKLSDKLSRSHTFIGSYQ